MGGKKITAPQLPLPKGGGAIQGIGESFQASEFTGTAALSIPIPSSPCRGFEPRLSVEYSSGSGNGIFGLGFGLAIPNVSRKTSKGLPRYDDTDIFLLSNAEDLVPIDSSERTAPPVTHSIALSLTVPAWKGCLHGSSIGSISRQASPIGGW
jgi:hypothetical protein